MKVLNFLHYENKFTNKMLQLFYESDFMKYGSEAMLPSTNVDGSKSDYRLKENINLTISEIDDLNDIIKTPKIPRCEGKDKNHYDIDEYLGKYLPKTQEIHLFNININEVAKILSFDEQQLKEIVLLHELGHWITHRLPDKNGNIWNGYSCSDGNKNVHEGWAQLLTWWAIKDSNVLKETFVKLNNNQSPPYQIWKQFIASPPTMKSLQLLREMKSPTLDNWKTFEKEINDNPEMSFEDLKYRLRGYMNGRKFGII